MANFKTKELEDLSKRILDQATRRQQQPLTKTPLAAFEKLKEIARRKRLPTLRR